MSTTKNVSINRVIEVIKMAFPAYVQEFARDEDGRTDYDTMVPVTNPANLPQAIENVIVWEDCSPYGWAYSFPFGGLDEEFGGRLKDVSASLPAGVWIEALNSYSIAVRFDGDDLS